MPITSAEEKIPDKSLRDVYYILFRHKWKIILFFLFAVITATFYTLISPDIYQSQTKILVRVGRESVTLDPTATTGPVISLGQQRENEIKSELEILNSSELVEKVVDAIGPDVFLNPPEEKNEKGTFPTQRPSDPLKEIKEKLRVPLQRIMSLLKPIQNLFGTLTIRDKAIIKVMKSLKIEVLRDSNLISISFEAESRKLAQETVDKLIGFYLDKHISVHRTAGSYEFFNKETDQLRKTLAQVEEDLRKLKNKTGIASLEEQRRTLITRIGDLQKELGEAGSTLAASKVKVQAIQKTLNDLPETLVTQEITGIGNHGADLMRSKLYELQLKEQDLLSKFTENSTPVKEVRRQIAEAQALLAKEEPARTQVTKGINEAYKQMQLAFLSEKAMLSSLQAKANELQAQLANARSELKAINDTEILLIQTQREINIKEANYRKYYEKLEQARIDNALEIGKISNISVVQPATYPVKPIRPKKSVNLALGLFLGIIGGIGLAFFSEYIDHTFKKPEDVEERLKLPALAAIPYSRKNKVAIS